MGCFSIETDRLILRPITLEDAGDLYMITRDDSVQKYVPYACPKSFEDAKHFINKFYAKCDFVHDFYIAIELKGKREVVGFLIVTQNVLKQYDMSLITAARHRRNGFMREAVSAFAHYMPKGAELLFIIEKSNRSSYALVSKLERVKDITKRYVDDKKFYAFSINV